MAGHSYITVRLRDAMENPPSLLVLSGLLREAATVIEGRDASLASITPNKTAALRISQLENACRYAISLNSGGFVDEASSELDRALQCPLDYNPAAEKVGSPLGDDDLPF